MIATFIGYSYYLKDKDKDLILINEGICPKCKNNSIELIDVRGGGCSPKNYTYKCTICDYENSFTKPSNCSI